MADDRTPPPVPPAAPTCPQCAIQPHDEPEKPHVHLTNFGYVLFTPNHKMRDYIEEIREFERAAGRKQAAADIAEKILERAAEAAALRDERWSDRAASNRADAEVQCLLELTDELREEPNHAD